ncbi:MAG: bifunctional 2-polyprenyl-6-hydroxyphenol methylase/3-demethylubiquinol 3-O-methyltransferase UbiG [Geminicoccaceae bacterium]
MGKQLTGSARAATPQPQGASALDRDEVAKFEALAEEFWDPAGPMRPLHKLNPLRIAYVRDHAMRLLAPAGAGGLRPLAGLRLADIGCGAGLLSEPMARLGAEVTGVDPSPRSIEIARAHAAATGLAIDYRATSVEALAEAGTLFDVVLAMEVIEHTTDPDLFICELADITRPGGLVVLSTLNRTARSWLLGIVAAEYVLGWLPRGTHQWQRFVPPATLARLLRRRGLRVIGTQGVVYRPHRDDFVTSRDLAVNYMISAVKD